MSVTELPVVDVERVCAAGTLYSARGWFEMAEGAKTIQTAYVCAWDGERLIGLLPFHRAESWSETYDPAFLFPDLPGAAEWSATTVAGNKAAYRTELTLDPALDRDERLAVLRALVERLEEELRGAGERLFRLMYVTSPDTRELEEALGGRGVALLTAGDTRVDLPPGGFDGYLASLKHARRRTIRRERRRFQASGARVERARLSDRVELVARMYVQLTEKYGQPVPLQGTVGMLSHFARFLSDQCIVFVLERGGEPSCCSVAVEHADGLYMRMIGFDYDRSVRGDYFNMGYYEPIEYAYERGLRTIWFGTQSYEPKLLRGAAFEPLWCILAASDGLPDGFAEAAAEWNREAAERLSEEIGLFVQGGLGADELEQRDIQRSLVNP